MKKTVFKLPLALFITAASVFALFWIANFLIQTFIPLPRPDYGITFSTTYSKYLGLDPVTTHRAILDELGVKRIRLPIYWDEVEKKPGQFDFSLYDRLIDQSQTKNVQVIVVAGYKVPRWPECYPPEWAKTLNKAQLKDKTLDFLEATIDHFKNRPNVIAWQIENEPLLEFGECQALGERFLQSEIDLVRSRDSRLIILTDSGELGIWAIALRRSNIMGTSLYRIVWNPLFGYFRYPFPPIYYSLKAFLTQKIFAPDSRGVFISEVQAEPWAAGKSITQIPLSESAKLFTPDNFQEVILFTSQTRLKEQYLWGAEWWYFMKIHGYPEYWEYAKSLFSFHIDAFKLRFDSFNLPFYFHG